MPHINKCSSSPLILVKRQRGVAMLLVLFIMALMAIIAVNINETWQRTVTSQQITQFQQRTKWLLLGAEALLLNQLDHELATEKQIILSQSWANETYNFALDEDVINATVTDLNSCFNLNALYQTTPLLTENPSQDTTTTDKPVAENETAEPVSYTNPDHDYLSQVFTQLLFNLNIDPKQAQSITFAIHNWLAQDTTSSHSPLHKPSVQKFIDVSELRNLPGVTQEIYQRISPFVCVLPNSTELKLNINTLSPKKAPLFAALFNGKLNVNQAENVLSQQPENGWQDIELLLSQKALREFQENYGLWLTHLILESHYFKLLLWQEQSWDYPLHSTVQRTNNQWYVLQRRYGITE